jgi:hypothetical protein
MISQKNSNYRQAHNLEPGSN